MKLKTIVKKKEERMVTLRKLMKNKKGFVSIEAILATSTALMVVLVAIGFFTLIYPRVMLQMETHNLAQKAKIQGGLTTAITQPVDSDIEQFMKRMMELGYERDDVEITATTKPGNYNAIGVTPLQVAGSNYVKRDSKEMIHIVIRVPANTSIKAPLGFFRNDTPVNEKYTIVETVMSERW
jgi:hypothetical protein